MFKKIADWLHCHWEHIFAPVIALWVIALGLFALWVIYVIILLFIKFYNHLFS